ncbi:hypothetical protein F5Y03DRAFT_397692 [Xylaria venustula]|nr:hypothetical protein F5Y03DRAFT_397692 [Xylaria venustula]
MSQPTQNQQATNMDSEAIVETNNFHQVIKKFNDSGDLIEETTKFLIECQICQCKSLALMAPDAGIDSHEEYVVLPQCGHAFGSDCLQHWFESQWFNRKCPLCRTAVDCTEGHRPLFHVLSSRRNDLQKTREDIKKIRNVVGSCSQCGEERQNHPQDNNVQQPEDERALETQNLQQAEAIEQVIQTIMREGSRMEWQNLNLWQNFEHDLSGLHLAAQERNHAERLNTSDREIFMERNAALAAIDGARHRGARHGAEEVDWDGIGRQLSHLQEMAEARNERRRRHAQVAEQIRQHIAALEDLMSEVPY